MKLLIFAHKAEAQSFIDYYKLRKIVYYIYRKNKYFNYSLSSSSNSDYIFSREKVKESKVAGLKKIIFYTQKNSSVYILISGTGKPSDELYAFYSALVEGKQKDIIPFPVKEVWNIGTCGLWIDENDIAIDTNNFLGRIFLADKILLYKEKNYSLQLYSGQPPQKKYLTEIQTKNKGVKEDKDKVKYKNISNFFPFENENHYLPLITLSARIENYNELKKKKDQFNRENKLFHKIFITDMEAYFLQEIASEKGIPFFSLKIISDINYWDKSPEERLQLHYQIKDKAKEFSEQLLNFFFKL